MTIKGGHLHPFIGVCPEEMHAIPERRERGRGVVRTFADQEQIRNRYMLIGAAKKIVKRIVRKRLKQSVIIAGMGRCGTTLMYKAIGKTVSNPRGFVLDLGGHTFHRDLIKTHDYPSAHAIPLDAAKAIFMFGDVVSTVLSTAAEVDKWPRLHFNHLRVPHAYRPYSDIFEADLLHFQKLFDAWYQPQQFDLLTLRYETMWKPENRAKVQQFIGLDFPIPAYRPRRTSKVDHPATKNVENTYASLIEKIEAADDCKVWNHPR